MLYLQRKIPSFSSFFCFQILLSQKNRGCLLEKVSQWSVLVFWNFLNNIIFQSETKSNAYAWYPNSCLLLSCRTCGLSIRENSTSSTKDLKYEINIRYSKVNVYDYNLKMLIVVANTVKWIIIVPDLSNYLPFEKVECLDTWFFLWCA